jgi:hypothetical protein
VSIGEVLRIFQIAMIMHIINYSALSYSNMETSLAGNMVKNNRDVRREVNTNHDQATPWAWSMKHLIVFSEDSKQYF